MNKKDDRSSATPLPASSEFQPAQVPSSPTSTSGYQVIPTSMAGVSRLNLDDVRKAIPHLGVSSDAIRITDAVHPYLAKVRGVQRQFETVLPTVDMRIKNVQAFAKTLGLGEQFTLFSKRVIAALPNQQAIDDHLDGGRQRAVEVATALRRAYEKRFEHYPRLAENLDSLANQGWFVSVDLPLSVYEELAFSLERLANAPDRMALVDNLFVECFQPEIEELCKSLVEDNPRRAFAIQPAVAAHLRGEYALSVPVFFAQAEGIVRDRTEREFFTRPRGKPWEHVNDWAKKKRVSVLQTEDPFDYFEDALWSPLVLDLPITWSPEKRKNHKYTGLNRNTTLHGIDLGYASEVNSLKAFSLLCYVSSVLSTDPKMQAEEGQE